MIDYELQFLKYEFTVLKNQLYFGTMNYTTYFPNFNKLVKVLKKYFSPLLFVSFRKNEKILPQIQGTSLIIFGTRFLRPSFWQLWGSQYSQVLFVMFLATQLLRV